MEAINKYYFNDEKIVSTDQFIDDKDKSNIIYEVLRVINGNPVFFKEHFERMEESFHIVNKEFNITYDEMFNYVTDVIKANNIEGNIKITYNIKTDVLNIYYIKHSYPTEEMYLKGVKTILYYGERENPNAKIVNKEFREKINLKLKESGAFEAILVDRYGCITEGSKSNIFAIKDNTLITAKGEVVLKGVTRAKIIDIAKDLGVEIEEKKIKVEEIKEFDSMFISGTSPKILPIKSVDEMKFNIDNEIMKKIMLEYDKKIKKISKY